MTVFVCVSDKGGIFFGGKRQSRDRKVTEDILGEAGDGKVMVREYSKSLFVKNPERITVVQNPLSVGGEGDFVFSEGEALSDYVDKIKRLIIYRWNRDYPQDMLFDIDPCRFFSLLNTCDFEGNSHEKITKEVWVR